MPKTLAELIADAAANDDVQFTGPDGLVVKLGDIRGFRSAVETEKKTLQTKQSEAERVATEAQKLLTALDAAIKEQEAKNTRKTEPDTAAWKKNPLYEELVPVFDHLEQLVQTSTAQATAAKKELASITAFYTIERMRQEYNAAPESFRKAKPFETVVQEALANGDLESYGAGENAVRMPTLRKRIHEGTEADRIETAVKAGVAAAKVEWDKQQKAASIPKPQGRISVRAKDEKLPIKNLSELTSELVAADPDVQAAMEGEVH